VGLPPSPVETSSHYHFYKLSRCWLLDVCYCSCWLESVSKQALLFSAQGALLFGVQGTLPSLLHVFIVLIAYYSVSLFPLGGGRSVQGAMLIWPRDVCGSTANRLDHLVGIFPSCLGMGSLWPGGPSRFLRLMWSGDCLHRLEVWRGQNFASSRWPCLQGMSPASLQDFTLGDTLSASSL
jgi:hypothetical protein